MIKLWGWMTREHEFDSRREQTVELPCPIQLCGYVALLLMFVDSYFFVRNYNDQVMGLDDQRTRVRQPERADS